jgi:spermidine synthase
LGPAVLVAVFAIATCGLVYELIAGTLASYVLGDSVTQFSTIIGVYLFAMGAGSWLSRFIDRGLVARFVEIEIAVALLGGCSAAVLFLSFARLSFFRLVLYLLVFAIGTLVGLEVPLLMRILKDKYDLKDLVSRVLTADYLGALLASLAFPLFLVPELGLVRGSFLVGALNAGVAIACTFIFTDGFVRARQAIYLRIEAIACLVLLAAGFGFSNALTHLAEEAMYADPIVLAKSTPYQRIVVTQGKGVFQLFLNGSLQFASSDEHRYHEALVHPVMSVARSSSVGSARRALILGGGDGLALRELLRYPQIERVTLVDLDQAMTDLGRRFSLFRSQNKAAFDDPRVQVVNEDALAWLSHRADADSFDVIVIDFPDPNNFTLGKLYTTRFYTLVLKALSPEGAVVVQATSPLFARRSFWCVARTMEASGFFVRAYHALVPSFGEWGYVLASRRAFDVPQSLPESMTFKFLTPETMSAMFVFPLDMGPVETGVNRLNNQVLVQYYEAEWAKWN